MGLFGSMIPDWCQVAPPSNNGSLSPGSTPHLKLMSLCPATRLQYSSWRPLLQNSKIDNYEGGAGFPPSAGGAAACSER